MMLASTLPAQQTEKVDAAAIARIREEGLIVASFVYLAANRDEKLPRKPQAITP